MKIYIGHSTSYDYENELYKVIRNDKELNKYDIILPHENGTNNSFPREFYDNIDIFIAEVSYRSTGLGVELGFAFDSKVNVYFIYKKGCKYSSSLNFFDSDFYEYGTNEELISTIKTIINK